MKKTGKKKIIGIISLVFTVIVWGITFLATKILLECFTPIEIMFFRFALAYVSLLLCYPKIFKWQGIKVEALCFLASIMGISVYQTLENVSIKYANASIVAIIIATASFFTAIFSRIILKDKNIKSNFYIGFIVSMIGIALVSFNGTLNLNFKAIGIIISILCAVLWGVYTVVVELINRYKLNLIQTTRRIMLDAFITLIPMFFISGGKFDLGRFLEVKNVIWIVFLGILASAICFCTWNYCVDALGTVTTSYGVLVQPIVTVIVGAIWFNEPLTLMGGIGIALTIVGLYIALFIKKKSKEVVPNE